MSADKSPVPLPGLTEPTGATDEAAVLDRRDLMKLIASSMALAGLGGCSEPPLPQILPYVRQPPEITPGMPLQYASSLVLDGLATGVLVTSREGRPIKIEGNPEHPSSLGAAGVLEQAAVLSLYDPDRARAVLERGLPRSWDAFYELVAGRERLTGLRVLLPPQSSPLMAALIDRVQGRHPDARFTFYTPLDRRPVYEGAQLAFGRPLEPQYDFRDARVVLSLDADFTAAMPGSLRWARDLATRRRLSSPRDDMSRLYVLETALSPTGSIADHRLAVRAGEVLRVAAAALAALVAEGAQPPGMPAAMAAALPGALEATPHAPWIQAVARDLARNRGQSLVLAGPRQPAETHALAHLLNAALGNLGRTVTFTEPVLLEPLGPGLADLVSEIRAGQVETLAILECNPVYTAPPDLGFDEALGQVPTTVHLAPYRDETSALCQWFLPAAHALESWGDARAHDGTVSFLQPLIRTLWGGRSPAEVLTMFAGERNADAHAMLRDFWLQRLPAVPSPRWHWERNLQRGLLAGSDFPAVPVELAWAGAARALRDALAAPAPAGMELAFEASHAVHDGRFTNNVWLLELPQPLTGLSWDNAALMSPATAARLGVDTEDVVVLARAGQQVRAPVLVQVGHADEAVTLALGWGRRGTEAAARNRGVNAYLLRTADAPGFGSDLTVEPTGESYVLARTQEHWQLHGRPLALQRTLDAYRAEPDFTAPLRGPLPTLLSPQERGGMQWAMTIDTTICTGCSSCMIACQAENNVPVVGKQGVARSREMYWLRIDTYFSGPPDAPEVVNQPMMCQHCEHAPCEYVCPVYATTHSPDGLNEMTYNRCIGTRFCSNNCPYKVRRFNWFEYNADDGVLKLQHNPDVTVRERGVIEKCTYCVQRIRRSEIQARIERRELGPGDVVTACQQACPTGAIQFGSLSHEQSAMVRWRRQPRSYAVLHQLGTRPRTMYLAKITNPNPEMD